MLQLVKKLATINESADRNLEEGLEETLTLHRLTVFAKLGVRFKITNLIETIRARVEAKTHCVSRWRTSD